MRNSWFLSSEIKHCAKCFNYFFFVTGDFIMSDTIKKNEFFGGLKSEKPARFKCFLFGWRFILF